MPISSSLLTTVCRLVSTLASEDMTTEMAAVVDGVHNHTWGHIPVDRYGTVVGTLNIDPALGLSLLARVNLATVYLLCVPSRRT